MKFRITMKDPDGAQNSLDDAAKESMPDNITDKREREAIYEVRREKVAEAASKWLGYGEYLTVEFDTEANTATVIEDDNQ